VIIKKLPIKAVLFDLDGTLLDTANDLGIALNRLRASHAETDLPLELIRPAAGKGCKGLLKLGLNMEESHPDFAQFSDKLLDYYLEHLLDTTRLFAGMELVLEYLENANIPWGIVTNKPGKFTQKLVDGLQLSSRAGCIISGDTLPNRKPHPEPILHACKLLQHQPADCLYVGDAEIDMIASKMAGTASLVALYGYISEEDKPHSWQADGYIQRPTDILAWIS